MTTIPFEAGKRATLADVALHPIHMLLTPSTSLVAGYEAHCVGGSAAELELRAMERSFAVAAASFARHTRLFVEVDPAALDDAAFAARMLVAVARSGLSIDRLVFQIAGTASFARPATVLGNVRRLREKGAAIALDDFDDGQDRLRAFEQVRPSFVTVGEQLGAEFQRDARRAETLGRLQRFALHNGALLVMKGVTSADTMSAARELGIRYAQGSFFGRPVLASTLLAAREGAVA